ncbi:CBS domain-containing protein [Nitriliruptoraceae bacterium ZYF776]|nr:CBS domain-containing protein [Profundirhabdus halotolerans]
MQARHRHEPVATLVTGAAATISPSDTLRAAARALTRDHLGLLVVCDASGLRGVLSERDVVTAAGDGLDLDLERVVDHATDDVVRVPGSTSVADATRTMLAAQVRHLVVDRGGAVSGVVSLRDLAAVLLEGDEARGRAPAADEVAAGTLAP